MKLLPKRLLIHFCLLIVFISCTSKGYSKLFIDFTQVANLQSANDSDKTLVDSLGILLDSARVDTILNDSLQNKRDSLSLDSTHSNNKKEKLLEETVVYNCKDSMRFDLKNQTIFLYGDAKVVYGSLELQASFIEFDMGNSEVYATGLPDSTGEISGKPIFIDKGKDYNSDEMRYNFKTQKGLIKNATTQEGDGYVVGTKIKRQPDEIIYVSDGKFCPCEDPEAGTFIKASKIKIIPDDKIVTGPANLYIADIPTPLILPFGIFPNTEERASGLIVPRYGNSPGLGFFLADGGFYWAKSEYADYQFTGDIYSNGSFGANVLSGYNRRYKHNGNYQVSYSRFTRGIRDLPNYSRESNFFVRWNHTQDRKSNPANNFSATVNAGTANNFRTNFNSRDADFLNNQFNSNIQYTLNLPNKPFSVVLNASHSQNSRDSTISMVLPRATLNVPRLFPFKNASWIKRKSVLKDVGINFSASAFNQVNNVKQDVFLTPETINLMQTGLNMNSSTSLNLKILKHFTLTPSFNSTSAFTTKTIEQNWNPETASIRRDTVPGIRGYADWNVRTNLATTVYGMYNFKNEDGKIVAIRHRIIPTVGMVYIPSFNSTNLGYYKTVRSGVGENQSQTYSIFQGTGISGPNQNQNASLTFQLNNNLEMKTNNKKDTANPTSKIKLLENLNAGGSYNFMADSLNLSDITINANTTILNNLITINARGTVDPYQLNDNGIKINKFMWESGAIGRFKSGNFSANLNLKSKDKKTNTEEKEKTEAQSFKIPWNLSIRYVLDYIDGAVGSTVTQTLNFNGSISITDKWDIRYTSGFDFEQKAISYTSFDIYRDLNCWELRIGLIPFGVRKSYNFSINIKPAMLSDLKFERKREWFDFE